MDKTFARLQNRFFPQESESVFSMIREALSPGLQVDATHVTSLSQRFLLKSERTRISLTLPKSSHRPHLQLRVGTAKRLSGESLMLALSTLESRRKKQTRRTIPTLTGTSSS